jgi:hypothetical protein
MRITSSAPNRRPPSGSDWRPPGGLFVQPRVLTILGTYKCTAACENCCFGSNPKLTTRLDLPEILAFISEGSRYPECRLVAFSGGECFLLGDDLVAAVAHATSLGLATRCVTNGYWARRMDHGRKRLGALKEAGLTQLNISTGDYHQRWVTEEAVANAACLSVELGLKETLIVVEAQKARRVTAQSFLAANPRIRGLLEDSSSNFHIIESPWMPMNLNDRIDQDQERLINRKNVHLRTGCDSIFRTGVLTPDRKYGFCCGLSRERIPELNGSWSSGAVDELIDRGSRDFMKIWLFVDGPERILAWAASKERRIDWENRYAHHCHACLALFADPLVRETIKTYYQERVEDVMMRYVTRLRTEQATIHYVRAPA